VDVVIIVKALLLGIVEGITEFLPISSASHLIVPATCSIQRRQGQVFEIVIQLGAILAVVWEYHAKLFAVARGMFGDLRAQRFVLNLLVAFMPAAILGFLFHDAIKVYLFNPVSVAMALIVGGLVILWVERRPTPVRVADIDAIGWRDALLIGVAQCASLIGTSAPARRSSADSAGLSRVATAGFVFLTIPIMFAATGFDLYKTTTCARR
jgi:undecaprenyl-diphosphatase